MNFKSRILAVCAVLGLALATALPVAADPTATDDDTETITVVLTENGAFAVDITSASLTGGNTSATTTVDPTGGIDILYTDTKSYRNGFFARLHADDFTSTLAIPTDGGFYGVDASKLLVEKNFNVVQGRCTCRSSNPTSPRIGDIGATPFGSFNSYPGSTTPYEFGSGGATAGHNWFDNMDGASDLDSSSPATIARGLEGPGTAGSDNSTGSTQHLDIKLDLSDGQPATTYTSTLYITVVLAPTP